MLGFLRTGVSPGRLAFTLALGMTLSCFPLFGATTILCAVVALLFRLSLPVIEVGNYLALPLQFVLLIPFMRMGERLFHSPRLPLSPPKLLEMMRSAPDETMRLLLADQWHAIAAWAVISPGLLLLFFLLLLPLIRLLLNRAAALSDRADPREVGGTIIER